MSVDFIHLRVHSEYSLVDGLVKLKPLIEQCIELGMPAVAVTDQSNLFSLVKFYRIAQNLGVKAIAGSDVLIHNPDESASPYRLTLLIQNHAGYIRLSELISLSYQKGQHQSVPMLDRQWLKESSIGLIALSGAREGDVGRSILAGKLDLAKTQAQQWAHIFPDRFYLEVQRLGKQGEQTYLSKLIEISHELVLPVVATNDVRFISTDEFDAHEIRVCINQGRVLDDSRRPKDYTNQQFFRSTEQMQALFADLPEALENTVEIAKRCNLELSFGKSFLPDFPVPESMTMDAYFTQLAEQGLAERLLQYPPKTKASEEQIKAQYSQRLADELKVIIQMGFPGYFLIVADFIKWAKNNAIPVGPGRGSGAGSLVAYVLKITDLDPIEFDLLFERFLNPERVSMPDFDVDFCMDRRDEVIDYVVRRYGRDHVAQIITYGTMAAKAVVRDVGRVLGYVYGFVDRLAKLIPFGIDMTLQKALKDSEEFRLLYKTDEEVKVLIDMALALEGVCRNAGKHAGGVVISPTKLTNFTPLYCEQDGSNLITQFDKDDVETIGLVKFDFLGLRTLTIIDWAIQTINSTNDQILIVINHIPRNDAQSYELLKKGETTGVFQLESRNMKKLIKKLMPDCFDDIIALVALHRPGPLESGMVDDYIKVKHGAKAEYAHPMLEPILQPTNGVILYQEQVMRIARELAGYTLGGADLLRRAMSKKKPEEMAKQRTVFTEGAVANNIEEKIATYIFDLMEKFAGYGFNKSHSVAYALIAYQTAWLKGHYPAAFMAAVLSSDMNNTDKVVMLIEECRLMQLKIRAPDVNTSQFRFTIDEDNQIIYGIGAIKGVGQSAIEALLADRKEQGVFSDFYDLCKRVELRKVNCRVFEALIRAGALDVFDNNRAGLMAELPIAMKVAEQHGKTKLLGQHDLFGLDVVSNSDACKISKKVTPAWSKKERLALEKQALGLYLTDHPIDQYLPEISKITHGTVSSLITKMENSRDKVEVSVAGLVVDLRTRQTRQGKTMGFAVLDDRTGRLEVALYNDVFEKYREVLSVDDQPIIVQGSLAIDNFSGGLHLVAETLYSMEQARNKFAHSIVIDWIVVAKQDSQKHIESLSQVLPPYCGGKCPIVIGYQTAQAKALVQLGDNWRIHPSEEVLDRLRKIEGFPSVTVRY